MLFKQNMLDIGSLRMSAHLHFFSIGIVFPIYSVWISVVPVSANHMQSFNMTWAKQSNRTCFSCSLDFRYSPFDSSNDCLAVVEPVSPTYLVLCGVHEVYCQENFYSQNGVLLTLSRSCASSCYNYCKSSGFGVTKTVCNFCCDQDGCNDNEPQV